jgi:negative regulator of genetic competence, sporulation and motility
LFNTSINLYISFLKKKYIDCIVGITDNGFIFMKNVNFHNAKNVVDEFVSKIMETLDFELEFLEDIWISVNYFESEINVTIADSKHKIEYNKEEFKIFKFIIKEGSEEDATWKLIHLEQIEQNE